LIIIAVAALVFCFLGPLWPLAVIITGPIVGGWIGGSMSRRRRACGLFGLGTAYAASVLVAHVYDTAYPGSHIGGVLGPELLMALGFGAMVGWFGGLLAWAFSFDEIR
jgi:hypothetical protein